MAHTLARAKFICSSVTKREGPVEELCFEASHRDDGSNKDWSKWTPSGRLTMTVTNENLLGRFVPGKAYYLDISEVE